ncbi:MAG: outer membrane beta-barrel protein [Vicinamibacterales bacterium]
MRALICTATLALTTLVTAVPASAQLVHSLQLGAGLFMPRGLDSRTQGDVLVRNYFGEAIPSLPNFSDALAFDVKDFRGGRLFGEWNIAFGDHVEVGAGLGFYRKTVPTVYLDLVDPRGLEVEQQLKLQIVPVTGVVRFLPFGRPGDVQPYVGAGVSLLNYRYSESGDFIDTNTLDIFSNRYTTSGSTLGGLLLGGVRFPIGGDVYGMAVEGRYQFGAGKTGGIDKGFLAEKIDLSGGELNFSFLVRF